MDARVERALPSAGSGQALPAGLCAAAGKGGQECPLQVTTLFQQAVHFHLAAGTEIDVPAVNDGDYETRGECGAASCTYYFSILPRMLIWRFRQMFIGLVNDAESANLRQFQRSAGQRL